MLKKILPFFIIGFLLLPIASLAKTAVVAKVAVKKVAIAPKPSLNGRFAIQTDVCNYIWYIDPAGKKRYLIKNQADFTWLINKFGISITALNLKKLATAKGKANSATLLKKYKGSLIYPGKDKTTIWFVNPGDNVRYPISNFNDLAKVASVIGTKITGNNLKSIAMNSEQFTFDPAFSNVAYAKYDGVKFEASAYGDQVLPIASLTKVMTALVLVDQNLDFNQEVTVTDDEINYPRTLVGDGDATSEVNLRAGDRIKISDLWIAMLTASSNQSAAILANNSGLTRDKFVEKMNAKANSLGLKHTNFVEMTGLDPNNISTPKEMAIIGNAAFSNNTIASATRYTDYKFWVLGADNNSREVEVLNRNYSLIAMGPDAAKTGFLIEAQRNAVIKKNGYTMVVLHAYNLPQRNTLMKKMIGETILASAN